MMQLRSDAFMHGATIPRRYTCDGENISPALAWSDAPAASRSFVLLCDDPDAPSGTWHHWAVHGIRADCTALAEGAGRRGAKGDFVQAINDFRQPGYGGPCPPRGHGPHHYRFRLLALSADRLNLPNNAGCRDVEREARKLAIAEATLVGVYQR